MHILRVFAVFAATATGVWVGRTWENGPAFDAVAGIFITLGAYLALEISDLALSRRLDKRDMERAALSHHDRALGDRLCGSFSTRMQYFLRDGSFELPYPEELFGPLRTLTFEWQGIDYRFDDQALEARAKVVVEANQAFVSRLGQASGMAERYPGTHYSIPTEREIARDDFDQHTWDAIRDVHVLAKVLLDAYEAFRLQFRQRADVASIV